MTFSTVNELIKTDNALCLFRFVFPLEFLFLAQMKLKLYGRNAMVSWPLHKRKLGFETIAQRRPHLWPYIE